MQTIVQGTFEELPKDDVFRLPVDNDGNLDWAYMDEYMSTVLKEVEATLENLSSVAFYTRNSLR